MDYAVVFNYSFDSDVAVYLFPDEEAAKRIAEEILKGVRVFNGLSFGMNLVDDVKRSGRSQD